MQPMRYRDIESAFFVVSDSFEKNSLALAFTVQEKKMEKKKKKKRRKK